MRLTRPGCLALLAAALAGQTQTGYTLYTLIGEWSSPAQSYPLFDRAFTSNGEFGGVATDGAGNVYVVSGPSISKINAQGIMIPVTGFGPAAVAPGERIWALLASTESYSLAGDSQGNLFIATGNAIYRVDPGGLMEYYASVPAYGVACDAAGNLCALLKGTQVVRVAPGGSALPVAGTGVGGSSGDGGRSVSRRRRAVGGVMACRSARLGWDSRSRVRIWVALGEPILPRLYAGLLSTATGARRASRYCRTVLAKVRVLIGLVM